MKPINEAGGIDKEVDRIKNKSHSNIKETFYRIRTMQDPSKSLEAAGLAIDEVP
jgi:hypothetical protein